MKPIDNPFHQYGSINHIDPFFQNLEQINVPNYLKATSVGAHTSFKTKICPFLLSGKCFKCDTCTFAHNEEELKKIPDLSKTKLCICYQMGYCQNGNDCSFAHGESELRTAPNFYKTSLCIPYMNGIKCRFGVKCRFAHGYNELRPSPDNEETLCSKMQALKSQSNYIPIYNPPQQARQMPKLMQFESLAEKVRKENLLKMSSNFQDTFSTSTLGTPMMATEQNFFSVQNKAPNLSNSTLQCVGTDDSTKYGSQMQLQMMNKKAIATKMSEQNLPTQSYY